MELDHPLTTYDSEFVSYLGVVPQHSDVRSADEPLTWISSATRSELMADHNRHFTVIGSSDI